MIRGPLAVQAGQVVGSMNNKSPARVVSEQLKNAAALQKAAC